MAAGGIMEEIKRKHENSEFNWLLPGSLLKQAAESFGNSWKQTLVQGVVPLFILMPSIKSLTVLPSLVAKLQTHIRVPTVKKSTNWW